jgi:hypothetical protein
MNVNYIKENGKIKAKAFPARAAIPIHLLNLTEEHIECIYEKPGSIKTNHYVPGTRIPIIEDNVLEIKNEKGLLNNAWHISTEIKTYLEKLGFKGKIIDII